MSNTAPSRADPVVVFPLSRWCPPQETSQPHPPHPKGPINNIPALVQIKAWRNYRHINASLSLNELTKPLLKLGHGWVITPTFFYMDVIPYIISYPLFADADTGIYPHPASQYHARPKAKRGIAMLSVDKFPYPRKQRGIEFIPCSNNIYDILNRFCSFKVPAITLIWPKSPYKHHSVTRSYRSGKESGRRSESQLWRHQWRSFVFISHADDVKREKRLHISRLLTNQKRESARSMG